MLSVHIVAQYRDNKFSFSIAIYGKLTPNLTLEVHLSPTDGHVKQKNLNSTHDLTKVYTLHVFETKCLIENPFHFES